MNKRITGPNIDVYEEAKDCGCVYIVRYFPSNSAHPNFRSSYRFLKLHNGEPMICPKHIRENEEKQRNDLEREKTALESSTELRCDTCEMHLGYIYANDIEGCRFYCDNCKNG